jgi:hypothetical protein
MFKQTKMAFYDHDEEESISPRHAINVAGVQLWPTQKVWYTTSHYYFRRRRHSVTSQCKPTWQLTSGDNVTQWRHQPASEEQTRLKPQNLIFSVLSDIKLKFVFIPKINVDAKYKCFLVFGGGPEMKKVRFWGHQLILRWSLRANTCQEIFSNKDN